MSRELCVFFSNGLTTADLNSDGKLPVERESLITEVNDGRRSSMSSASNDDGRGSSSHVLMAVLFNTSILTQVGRQSVGIHPKLCE